MAGAGDEILGPLDHNAQTRQVLPSDGAHAAGGQDALGADLPDARDAEKLLIVAGHDLHREVLQMAHGPVAFGVKVRVEIGPGIVQQLPGLKAVEPQQPVGLVEPVLSQQGRLGVQGGEEGILHHGNVGGIEHPLETVGLIKRLGEMENVSVGIAGGAHNELGALARRRKSGSVAILHQLPFVLPHGVPNLGHGTKNGAAGLVRRQGTQPLLGGQLNIDAEAVRQQSQGIYQLRRGAGDGLGVDIAVKAIFLPQNPQAGDHLLGGIVWVAQHAGGQEQALNIVAAVELHGQLRQLPGRKGGAAGIVGPAIDTVLAVVDTAIGHQHLQQGDAPSVGGKAVAASGDGGGRVADFPGLVTPAHTAGGTGGVILGGVGQYGQLFQRVHISLRSAAATAGLPMLQLVNQPHELDGQGSGADENENHTDSRHGKSLRKTSVLMAL